MAADARGEPGANLIAAAEAAASWARARRAAWTSAPVATAARPVGAEPLPPIEFEPAPTARHERPAQPRQPSPPIAAARPTAPIAIAPEPITAAPIVIAPKPVGHDAAPPPFVARSHEEFGSRPVPRPVPVKLIAMVGVGVAVLAGAVIGWPALSKKPAANATPAEDAAFVGPKQERPKPMGTLSVTSNPAGAQVLVDGRPRGMTPLTLKEIAPGKHEVLLKSNAGSVRRTVTIGANQTETLDEQIFSGWVTVYSPFEVTIAEGQRVLRPDERNQVMLPPGVHDLRLINRTLAYEAVLQVDVKPGEGTNVRLTPAPSSLTVTASEPADVLVDGVRAGQTPLNAFSVALGTHEIIVRRANGNEKRYTATIGVKPYTINVDF